jgi:aspartyl-tRNA(Asn)/glutamyl-tRNA(Gln) amidotransferase subunit A
MVQGESLSSWHKTSAADLGGAFRAKRVSPVEVLDDVLRQYERVNGSINAIVTLDEAGARQAANASEKRFVAGEPLGPLDGIPLTVKDNLHCRDVRTTWGSSLYKNFVPASDELPIARARAAGAVILGKTNVPPFTLQGYTSNVLLGTTRNPWDIELTPGGSSGGAAAAVACGLGPIGIGTDGGGSIRRPAGYTSLVGLKPSIGSIARGEGLPPILYDLEVIGLLARTVDDVSLLYSELSGADPRDRRSLAAASAHRDRFRLKATKQINLVMRFGDAPLDPEIEDAVKKAAHRFETLGYRVEEGSAPFPIQTVNDILDTIFASGLAWIVETNATAQVDPSLAALLASGKNLSAAAYLTGLNSLWELRAQGDRIFGAHGFLMTPTAAAMPWPAGEPYPRQIAGRDVGPRGHAVYTGFVNVMGFPAVALPAPRSPTGLPIGFQLVGRFGDDRRLITLAREYEAAWPLNEAWPAAFV